MNTLDVCRARVTVVFYLGLITFCLTQAAPAKLIIVNSTNNISPGSGETNLVQAINLLQDGDSIRFNIPGSGPFYLITPSLFPNNGYPAITNHNVTIDGYTQPGSAPNANPILSSNNARIQIVLDSRSGGGHVENINGYSLHEAASLLIKGATNVTLRGLCFLGPGLGGSTDSDPDRYAVSFALGANAGHIQGCWFGVDLDRTNVYRFQHAVTAFEGPGGTYINNTTIGVEKNAVDASAARGQFNVFVGAYVLLGLEGENYRISGNFFNVFPDGQTDYNVNGIPPYDLEAFIEIGRRGNNLILGTDGDGLNDAEERNIFGGVTVAGDDNLLEWYGAGATNMVIAGNYFGVAVDGLTRFTNSMKVLGNLPGSTTLRMGSDLDDVSDSLEANLISMNYPFDDLFPAPGPPGPHIFGDFEAGARVSARGNSFIGNNLPVFSYADGSGDLLTPFTNFCAPFMETNQPLPVLSDSHSSQSFLQGSCAPGAAPYTNVVIDLYLADEESWTNGQKFKLSELAYADPATSETKYYGFAQGRTYLGSFADNGPQDLDPRPGHYNFDLHSIAFDGTPLVTATANYSADPPGTHNGRTHTSAFAMPIILQAPPLLSIVRNSTGVTLFWPTNAGPAQIETSATLNPPVWQLVSKPVIVNGTNYATGIDITTNNGFFRLMR